MNREEISNLQSNQYNIWIPKYITSDRMTISPSYSSRSWGEKLKSRIKMEGDKGGYPIKVYGYILPQGNSYGESSFTFNMIDVGVVDNVKIGDNWKIDNLDINGLKNLLNNENLSQK